MVMLKGRRKLVWAEGKLREVSTAPALLDLAEAVDRFRSAPRGDQHPVAVGEELVQLRHLCDLLELEFARRAADYAATDRYMDEGSTSPVDWIRHECKMSWRAAENAICVGEQ